MSSGIAIRTQNLVKRYSPDVLAVDGLDLEIREGECFGLLGPNGAGKTTTIEILEGLLEPTSGDVEILGRRWKTDRDALRERLGLTLQKTDLHEKLSVREMLTMFASFYRRPRDIDEVLSLVSLTEKQNAWFDKLSGGQKQRVVVACALVGNPELLFLDEPTTGLDPQSRRQLWDIVTSFKQAGRTVLLTTHYMDEAEKLCDRVAIVDKGKVIALGTPRQLIQEIAGQEIVECALGAPVEDDALASLPGVGGVRRETDGFALTVSAIHVAVPALLDMLRQKQIPLLRLSSHSATLEDVFVTRTGRHLRD